MRTTIHGAEPQNEAGFIGLGNMGGRMSRCLVDAGVKVIGYDTVPENIVGAGALAVPDAIEVVRRCDVVLMSLPSSRIVERVVLGEEGLLSSISEGQILIDLSTSEPASTRRIHEAVSERGAQYLDAGISGGAAAAEKGALTLMVGGNQPALNAVRPLLDIIASSVFYLGDSGSGHAAKLLNNFLNAVSLSATAEVMVAAKKAGLELDVLLEVLNNSSGINFATLNRFPKIIHGDYLKGGLSNTLMLKDVVAYTEYVSGLGVTSLNSAGPAAAFGIARQLGYADQISNTVVDAIGDLSGGVRLYEDPVTSSQENPS